MADHKRATKTAEWILAQEFPLDADERPMDDRNLAAAYLEQRAVVEGVEQYAKEMRRAKGTFMGVGNDLMEIITTYQGEG